MKAFSLYLLIDSPHCGSAEDTHDSERIGGQIENEGPGANLAAAQVQRDFRDDLPTYLPSIYGCRSVEEFQCLNRIEEGMYK